MPGPVADNCFFHGWQYTQEHTEQEILSWLAHREEESHASQSDVFHCFWIQGQCRNESGISWTNGKLFAVTKTETLLKWFTLDHSFKGIRAVAKTVVPQGGRTSWQGGCGVKQDLMMPRKYTASKSVPLGLLLVLYFISYPPTLRQGMGQYHPHSKNAS